MLRVNDLFIAERMPLPESRWDWVWRQLRGRTAPTYPNRGRGLGSALLEFIVREARSRGFTRIEGDIFAKDHAANQGLPDWYRQRGFVVSCYPSGSQRVAGLVREM